MCSLNGRELGSLRYLELPHCSSRTHRKEDFDGDVFNFLFEILWINYPEMAIYSLWRSFLRSPRRSR